MLEVCNKPKKGLLMLPTMGPALGAHNLAQPRDPLSLPLTMGLFIMHLPAWHLALSVVSWEPASRGCTCSCFLLHGKAAPAPGSVSSTGLGLLYPLQ